MLSTTIDEHPFEWEDHLRKVCFAYNTSVQATTGYSPYFLMFGREARLPVDLLYQTDPGRNELTIPEYVSKLRTTLTAAYEGVRRSFGIHQEQQEEYQGWASRRQCANRGSHKLPLWRWKGQWP